MVKSMRQRWLVTWIVLSVWLLAGLVGYGVAVSSLPVNAQAIPTPVNKPKTTVLANTPYTLLLMKDNFTIVYWVDGKEHPAEYKQETLPGGAHYQFGLAMPAWVAVIGRYPDGRWKLSVEPNTGNGQAPGAQFAPVIGVTLVEPVEGAPTPTNTPTMTGTPRPTNTPVPGVTPTVTATHAPNTTPTVPPLVTPTACYPSFCVYGYPPSVGYPNVPSVHYYVGSGCGALVVQLEGPTVITSYNRLFDDLLEENLRRLVQKCLANPESCKELLTPEPK